MATNQMYCFSQVDSNAPWVMHPANTRPEIVASGQSEFITVLDVAHDFPAGEYLTQEHLRSIRYKGPIYFDFDGDPDEIGQVIAAFREFLQLLASKGVCLGSLRLYASGSKGFHCEIPIQTVLENPPEDGIAGFPLIQKELAHELSTQFMDFRVYTARRGRMWRCPNVKRSNGNYKVPVSVEEVMTMTPETYKELIKSPRPSPVLEAPRYCSSLATDYALAAQKFAKAPKRKTSSGKLKQMTRGRVPPSVGAFMSGRLPSGQGWNRIALQLGLLAHELGMSESELVQQCLGLIHAHQSDGCRYNTAAAREKELRKQYNYLESSSYAFSVAGMRSILPKGKYPDLTILGGAGL